MHFGERYFPNARYIMEPVIFIEQVSVSFFCLLMRLLYRRIFGLDGMIYQIVHIRFNTNSQLLISNWLLVSIFAAQYALYGIFSRVARAL